MQVFMRSGETRQIDNIILSSAACTPRMMASIVTRLQTFADRHASHFGRDRFHRVDEQDCEEAGMKAGQHGSGQQAFEIESVGILSPKLSPIPMGNPGELRATVTNSVTKLRGTEGNEISKFGEFRAIQGN
jgi:hypothetical protein